MLLESRTAFQLCLTYVIFAGLWILLSDSLLAILVDDVSLLSRLQILKGWFFVVITALLLYSLAVFQLKRFNRNAAALQSAEDLHRQTVEDSPNPIFSVNRHGTILSWNPACRAVFQRKEGFVGQSILSLLSEQKEADMLRRIIERVFEGERLQDVEVSFRCADGSPRHLLSRLYPVYDASGTVQSCVFAGTDITERKKTELERKMIQDALRLSEERYRVLFENNPAPMWVYDLETLAFLAVNDVALLRYGYSRDEFLSMTIKDIRPPEDIPALLANVAAVPDGYEQSGVWRHQKKDGTIIEVEITSHTIDFGGRKAKIVLAVDVTDRQAARRALEESEERLRRLIENSEDIIIVQDRQGRYIYYNANPHFGLTAAELLGKTPYDFHPPELADRMMARMEYVFETGESLTEEIRVRWKEEDLWFSDYSYPIRDEQGRIVSVATISRNITAQKRAEESIRRRGEMLEAVSFSSERFLESADWEQHIEEVLERLGNATEVSRVYLFENHLNDRGDVVASQRYEWAAPGIEPQIDNSAMQNVAAEETGFERWRDILLKGGTIFGHVRDFPEPERTFLEAQQIRSIAIVPLFVNMQLWGFLGFDECRSEREWSVEEVDVLKAAASALGAAIQRREVEDALRLSDSILQRAANLVLVADTVGRIVFVSPSSKSILGYDPEELMGEGWWRIVQPDPLVQHQERLRIAQCARREIPLDETPYEREVAHKDGSTRWLLWRDALGPVQLVIGVATDITERKRVEGELRTSEERFRNLVENINDIYYVCDANGKFVYASPNGYTFSGYTHDSLINSSYVRLIAPQDRRRVVDLYQRAAKDGRESVRVELRALCKDGTEVWVEQSTRILRDRLGNVTEYRTVVRDISERRKSEEALRLAQFSVDHTGDAAYWIDPDGRFLYVNHAASRMLGYAREELMRMSVFDIDPEYSRERWLESWQKLRENRTLTLETVHRSKDGRILQVEVTANYLEYDGRAFNFAFARDIGDRKRAVEALLRLEKAVEQTDEVIFMTDVEGTITYVNPAFEKTYGFSRNEAVGQTPRILKSGAISRESYEWFWKTILSGNSYRGEIVNKTKDGSLVTVEAAVNPIVGEDGKLLGFVAVQNDVTGRKRIEQERKSLEAQLFQAQKLESLGTLAGGIAHDFNNILGIILGHATLIEMANGDVALTARRLQAIEKAVQRGSSLVRQILTFARKTRTELGPVDVNAVVGELTRMLGETFPKSITLSLQLEHDLPIISMDQSQFHQALLNLCVNARDAMDGKGRLTITTGVVERSEVAQRFPEAESDRYIVVCVSDTGSGMDEQTRRRIFDPFFTTKEEGKGTGLGLAVVLGIVQAHNGFVDVDSTPGKGATFTLYLPVPEVTADEERGGSETGGRVRGGTETILLAEDEEFLLESLKLLLEQTGYRVLLARDGMEALDIFEGHASSIDLVISDLGLPKLAGDQLFHRMRGIHSDIKVVITSGYLEPEVKSELHRSGVNAILQKPYTPQQVLGTIRVVLEGKRELASDAA